MKFGVVIAPMLALSAFAADPLIVEQIIAKVNGEIITRTDMDRSKRLMDEEVKRRAAKEPEIVAQATERQKDILREKIDQMLLVQKGKELAINVDPEVSKWMADMQRKVKIADPEKFQQAIREETGQSFEDYKMELKNSILTRRVIGQEVGSKVNIPKADVRKYYEEHKTEFQREERVFLREILISTDGKDAAQLAAAEKKAKDISARAKKGEKFPDLARDNSDAPTAESMGELPPFKKGELAKDLEDMIWDKERSFVTEPVKRGNGWLIIKVDEHHKSGLAAFEETEQDIAGFLQNDKMQPELRKYLTRLRDDAFLEIREGWTDSGAAPNKSTKWSDPAQLKPETVSKEEVASTPRKKRMLWMVPVPGTETSHKSKSKSS